MVSVGIGSIKHKVDSFKQNNNFKIAILPNLIMLRTFF